jgi:hypothetical protein
LVDKVFSKISKQQVGAIAMIYTVIRTDKTVLKVRSEMPYTVGVNYSVNVEDEVIACEYIGSQLFREVESSVDMFTLISLGIMGAALAGFVFWACTVTIQPDSAVQRAAQTLTPNPVIDDGRFSNFGCSRGDIYQFKVSDQSGKKVGIVCQGLDFGWTGKAATPRFQD